MCTRNRPGTIGQAVESVLANDYPSFDVTVVDQSTTDATRAVLASALEADSRLRYLHVEQSGLSRAYNIGIRASEGEILAFTDDDCVAPPGWLRAITDAFARDPEAAMLYGQVLSPDMADQPSYGTPVLPIHRAERLSRRDGFKVFGMGANFAAQRRLFAEIGGFDEALGGGGPLVSSQDYDLAYRAYVAGAAILLRPEVRVTHHGARRLDEWPGLLRAYGIGDGAFYLKHVRCRDPFALRLLVSRLASRGARELGKRLLRRGASDFTYLGSMLLGMRLSLRFGVDRRTRLYVP